MSNKGSGTNFKIILGAIATTITIMLTVNSMYATNAHVKDLFEVVFSDLTEIKKNVTDIRNYLLEQKICPTCHIRNTKNP